VLGDWGAQLSACEVGERGLIALANRYPLEMLNGYFDDLLDYSEQLTRREIAEWPNGRYEFVDYIDGDGFTDEAIPIKVALTVAGDSLSVDFTGSSPQVRGALNSTASFTKSCTWLSVRCMATEDIPNNAGFFRPIDVIAPLGTIVNPRPPAACAARALTGYRIVDAMFGALAQVAPDRVPAAGEGGNTVVCISGPKSDGESFIIVDMLCGAWGGGPGRDGVDAVTNPAQNLSNTPVEILEAEHPVLIELYSLAEGSGGAGEFRGGLSVERHYRLLGKEAMLQLRSDRALHRPWGLAGGGVGDAARNVLTTDGVDEALPSKVTMRIRAGQVVRHRMAGGGGYGDPLRRSPEKVVDEVLDERITPAQALQRYGVVIDAEGRLDSKGTSSERRRRVATRAPEPVGRNEPGVKLP
jgi:N-methylhydantoinase B